MGKGGIIAIFPSMGWPKGVKRGAISSVIKTETMASPVSTKKMKVGMSPEVVILNTKLETYMETFVENQIGHSTDAEIIGYLEDKVGKEKNADTVNELHSHLEHVIEIRNDGVIRLNDELDAMAESTSIFTSQENLILSMDRMNLKQLEQFDEFLKLCMKKSEFIHLASTNIHPEYKNEELIYTALCDFAENNTKSKYNATNNYRVRIAPRQNSGLGRANSSSSNNGGAGYESQDTT